MADIGADQEELATSGGLQRLARAAANVERLEEELKAERELRDAALVEVYESRIERVDTIAMHARLTRGRVLQIVGAT